MTTMTVACGDVLKTRCDVLVLKYAQGLHGADRAAADALELPLRDYAHLSPGKQLHVPTDGRLPCGSVLFIGVPRLQNFSYAEIREFSRSALSMLAELDCAKATVAMTMHGVGYGLDEQEAFTAQVAGLMEYLQSPSHRWRPETLTLVERTEGRAQRMAKLLSAIQGTTPPGGPKHPAVASPVIPDAGARSDAKRHVFVAMPYDEEMEDVYEFGIREPVNASGCLCERCDHSIFTGDILDRIKKRIATATVVVADLTGANPNVYLEVGYAWGKEVPVLLVARKGEQLQFDVKTHKCVYYKNISDLKKQLLALMPELTAPAPLD